MSSRCAGRAARSSDSPLRNYSLSEQFLLLSLSQGFAILPMPEGDVYPGLSVIPLDDDFTEYAVLAYRPDRDRKSVV